MVAYDTILDKLASAQPNELLAAGFVCAFAFLVLWYVFSLGNLKISLWHIAFIGAAGFLLGSALQQYTGLMDWIELGLTGYNFGATMFLVGFLAMFFVMLWNCIATSGRTLVR